MTDPKRELAIQAAEAIDPTFAGHAMEVAQSIDPSITARLQLAIEQAKANRIRAQALLDAYRQGMNANAPRTQSELNELTSLLLNNGA